MTMTPGTAKDAADKLPFSCASWNIHRGKGNDGLTDPARSAAVLVQDIHDPHAGRDCLARGG